MKTFLTISASLIFIGLTSQAASNLNENTLREFKEQCKKKGSGSIAASLGFGKSEREQCFNELWARESRFENKMNGFVNALGIRVQILDSLNVQDKSKLTAECLHVTAKSYERPLGMNDDEFFRRLYLNANSKPLFQWVLPMNSKRCTEKIRPNTPTAKFAKTTLPNILKSNIHHQVLIKPKPKKHLPRNQRVFVASLTAVRSCSQTPQTILVRAIVRL